MPESAFQGPGHLRSPAGAGVAPRERDLGAARELARELLRLLRVSNSTRLSLVMVLCLVALLPVLLLAVTTSHASSPGSPSLCSCHESRRVRKELEDLRGRTAAEDAEAQARFSADQARALQVTARRQLAVIERQTEEIALLRQAVRGWQLLRSEEGLRRKQYEMFWIKDDDPRLWHQGTLRRHATAGFIAFSAYRLSPTFIVVTGIGPQRVRGERMTGSCYWITDEGMRIGGRLGLTGFNEHHQRLYEFLLLNCTLPPPPGGASSAPGAEDGFWTRSEGGRLEVKLDQEIFYPYVEKTGYKIRKPDSDGPFKHESVFCGPPMFGQLSTTSVVQWVAYHRFHAAIDHFVFYDAGGFTSEFKLAFREMIDSGIVTVQDFRESYQYDVWAQNQALAMHDCLFRSRETARWVWFHDLDEYILSPSTTTVPAILKKHRDRAFLSHGGYEFSVDACQGRDVMDQSKYGKYAVELLLLRFNRPMCYKEGADPNRCLDWFGMRKLIVNPRKVQRTYIHHTDPTDIGGLDLPVPELWHNHYKGLNLQGATCTKEPWKYYVRNDSRVADVAAAARKCAQEGFTNKAQCRPGLEP